MSDSDMEDLLKKHRKEKKELQAQIQALKKTASKGDKKKKKETTEEIAKLEDELNLRQKQELDEFEASRQPGESQPSQVDEITERLDSISTSETGDESTDVAKDRISKAQKRRDRKVQQEKSRMIEIERQEEENKNGLRFLEIKKMKEILSKRQLMIFDIPSDGDCLYNSIAHQLKLHSGTILSVRELRERTASVLRSHPDDFLPFITNPKSGEPLTDTEYAKYCQDLLDKPVWGGQIELRALTQNLLRPIEVIQAEGPPVLIGEEFNLCLPLVITYHRHYFGLGEHYNSTQKLPVQS